MARLSDFQIPSPGRNLVAEQLCDKNAEAIRNVTRFIDTRIGAKEAAAQSTPYGRDAAMTAFYRREGLHADLDKMCCDINMTEEQAKPIHEALNRHLDAEEAGESASDDEPPEADDDAEENEKPERISIPARDMHAALDKILDFTERREQKKIRHSSRDHSTGYITDSDFISKYLPPDKLCVEAENELRPRVMEAQEDNSARGYWAGLFYFLRSQPEGSRIRDCRRATLSTLISKTLAA
jgi:hypothetical protein